MCPGVVKLIVIHNADRESLSILSVGSRDIALWDVTRGQLEFSVNLDQSVDLAVLSTASTVVICAGIQSGFIVAVSLTSGTIEHVPAAEEYRGMTDLAVSADRIFVATAASGVPVLSMAQYVVAGNLCDPHGGHHSVPTKLLVSGQNDGQLVVGYRHGLVQIFDVDTLTVISSMFGHSGTVNSLHLLPSGQLISAADDQCAIIWNRQRCVEHESRNDVVGVSEIWTRSGLEGPQTGEELSCDVSKSEVRCYTVDSTRCLLYAGFSCGVVLVWNFYTGQFHLIYL